MVFLAPLAMVAAKTAVSFTALDLIGVGLTGAAVGKAVSKASEKKAYTRGMQDAADSIGEDFDIYER